MPCTHKYEVLSPSNLATCVVCAQQKQYDPDGKEPPVVIKEGIDFTKVDPHELSNGHKKAIALICKKYGIKAVGKSSGLPGRLLSGWMATYLRDKVKYDATMKARRVMAGLIVHLRIESPPTCALCDQEVKDGPTYSIHTTEPSDLLMHEACALRLVRILEQLQIRYEMGEK